MIRKRGGVRPKGRLNVEMWNQGLSLLTSCSATGSDKADVVRHDDTLVEESILTLF